jgi:hypothetical protein
MAAALIALRELLVECLYLVLAVELPGDIFFLEFSLAAAFL